MPVPPDALCAGADGTCPEVPPHHTHTYTHTHIHTYTTTNTHTPRRERGLYPTKTSVTSATKSRIGATRGVIPVKYGCMHPGPSPPSPSSPSPVLSSKRHRRYECRSEDGSVLGSCTIKIDPQTQTQYTPKRETHTDTRHPIEFAAPPPDWASDDFDSAAYCSEPLASAEPSQPEEWEDTTT